MSIEEAKKIFAGDVATVSTEILQEATKIILSELSKMEEKISTIKKFLPDKTDDLPGEIWKDIEGYEGLYQVSNKGRVKSLRLRDALILTSHPAFGKYPSVHLRKDNGNKPVSIHILVAKAFIPNPENKPVVNHKDGNKNNCDVENLEWVTCSENTLHAYKIGLMKSGTRNYQSKFSEEDIKYIRENCILRDRNFGEAALARKFNVSSSCIRRIVKGLSYKNC